MLLQQPARHGARTPPVSGLCRSGVARLRASPSAAAPPHTHTHTACAAAGAPRSLGLSRRFASASGSSPPPEQQPQQASEAAAPQQAAAGTTAPASTSTSTSSADDVDADGFRLVYQGFFARPHKRLKVRACARGSCQHAPDVAGAQRPAAAMATHARSSESMLRCCCRPPPPVADCEPAQHVCLLRVGAAHPQLQLRIARRARRRHHVGACVCAADDRRVALVHGALRARRALLRRARRAAREQPAPAGAAARGHVPRVRGGTGGRLPPPRQLHGAPRGRGAGRCAGWCSLHGASRARPVPCVL